LVVSNETVVPRRFFVHNESLDFFAALKNIKATGLHEYFSRLLKAEVAASRLLESITFGSLRPQLFRMDVQVD